MRGLGWAWDLLELFYPRGCARCGFDCESSTGLCQRCDGDLTELQNRPACGMCAMPLPQHESPCPYCLGGGPALLGRIARLGTFEEPLRELIHKLKYGGRWALAEHLADRLLGGLAVRDLLDRADVIVPVPLHPRRRWRRGFNQADLIAARLARGSGKLLRRPVIRLFDSPSQTKATSPAQREANVRDAFVLIRPKAVAGRRVLIVDDVMTTGATLRAVARALRPARPTEVNAVVLAIADPKGRGFTAI